MDVTQKGLPLNETMLPTNLPLKPFLQNLFKYEKSSLLSN